MSKNSGEPQPPRPEGSFYLRAGWMIDGLGGPARRHVVINVRDGLIAEISSVVDVRDLERAIDFSHACVLPMLMDAHVHLSLSGNPDAQERKRQLLFDRQQTGEAIRQHLQCHWHHGISAVREAGDRQGFVCSNLRRHGTIFSAPPVAVAVTRWAWHAAGRYGAMIGQTPPPGTSLAEAAANWWADIDHVKVIQSGLNSLERFGGHGTPQFPFADLSAVAEQAHRKGLKIMVHANGKAAVQSVLDASCDSLEHGYFMGSDNLRRLADVGVVWIPTLIPMAELAASTHLSASQRDTAQRTLEHQMEQIEQALRFGATIGLGTDSGSPGVRHGLAVHQELTWLMAAGLTAERAIASATGNIAKLMGQDRTGTLSVGHAANFLIIPEGMHRLAHGLSQIMAICWHGKWIPPSHAP